MNALTPLHNAPMSHAAPDGPGAVGCGSYSSRWFVVQVAQFREERAFGDIAALGFRVHLPLIVRRFAGNRWQPPRTRVVPLFPRYLFTLFDPDADPWGKILRVFYVVDILRSSRASRPLALPDWFVEAWQSAGRAGDGAIDDQALAFAPITKGEKAKVIAGHLKDYEGICQMSSADRVRLMLDVLGAKVPVDLPRSSVEAV